MQVFGRFNPLGFFIRMNGFRRDAVTELISLVQQGTTAAVAKRSYAPLGTLIHEAVHCFQTASTPFGQFWLRALFTQGLFTSANFLGVFDRQGPRRISLPLELYWPAYAGKENQDTWKGMQTGWQMIDALMEDLVLQSEADLGTTLPIHERAIHTVWEFGYGDRCAERACLPGLRSMLGDTAKIVPSATWHALSTRNVVEAHARLIEKSFLEENGDEEAANRVANQMDAAQESLVLKIMGFHHNAVHGYSEELVYTIFALIDLALFAPLDPALAALWSQCVLWEDIHPAYRYAAGAAISKEVGLLPSWEQYESYQEEICKRAGWYTPRRIIDELITRMQGSSSVYDRFFLACLEGRRECPHAFAMGLPSDIGFASPIVVYDDAFVVNPSRLNPAEHSQENVGSLTQNYAVRELARQLLFERSIARPEALDRVRFDVDHTLITNFGVKLR